MDKKDQEVSEVQRSNERRWLPYIVAIILLFIGSIILWILRKRGCICCTTPPGTGLTGTIPEEGTPFSQVPVGDYKIWFQTPKGIDVAIHTDEDEVKDVVELSWGNPVIVGSSDDFTLNRQVINFVVGDTSGAEITSFKKPIRLYFAYTRGDVDYAGGMNLLTFAFLNTENKWVEFKKDKHGYTLLRTLDNGITFQYWDWEESWKVLEPQHGYFIIGGQEVEREQLKFAYDSISSFPTMGGFAFAYVSEWGDRHIGGGRRNVPRNP